jgi:hypothetical protein
MNESQGQVDMRETIVKGHTVVESTGISRKNEFRFVLYHFHIVPILRCPNKERKVRVVCFSQEKKGLMVESPCMKSVDSRTVKSTYLRKLLTKPKKGQLQLSIPFFSRELSHFGMGVPSKTAYLFHLNLTFFRNAARPRQSKSAASTDPRRHLLGRCWAACISYLT